MCRAQQSNKYCYTGYDSIPYEDLIWVLNYVVQNAELDDHNKKKGYQMVTRVGTYYNKYVEYVQSNTQKQGDINKRILLDKNPYSVAAVLPIVLSFSVIEVIGVDIFFASLTVIDIIQSAKVHSHLVVLTADPFFPRKDFALVKGQGSSSPYVVSELTLVAMVSFHHPPLLDEQETEAVLYQLWTINLVRKRSIPEYP
ncbi:hypothetical protein K7X08_034134 [Anisodus acutangulus]|uniref:Uncharacterized protein n=1 Tax=Anisodus acutangulus TaxID=402998 RepID=A0A9Q1M5W1_9SOLA|nr:hypothetical protein K7X08_034134 [Anisodus acutangulus]